MALSVSAFKGGLMEEKTIKTGSQRMIQQNLFGAPDNRLKRSKFISIFRVALVKDRRVAFEQCQLINSQQSQPLIKKLIETQGQPDREQFCVILLNSKNEIIGLNIVSTGNLSSAPVHPREVLKPAILSNSAAMILSHNHPSGDLSPSPEDIEITTVIVQASKIMGIQVHEHLIISMHDDRYFSFADHGIIKKIYDEIN
jgi:DNA repair protein RadC